MQSYLEAGSDAERRAVRERLIDIFRQGISNAYAPFRPPKSALHPLTEPEKAEFLWLLEERTAQGDRLSSHLFGNVLWSGELGAKDQRRALGVWAKGAKASDLLALGRLLDVRRDPNSPVHDPEAASRFLERLLYDGVFGFAQVARFMVMPGDGKDRERRLRRLWSERGAAAGDARSIYGHARSLGGLRASPEDRKKARGSSVSSATWGVRLDIGDLANQAIFRLPNKTDGSLSRRKAAMKRPRRYWNAAASSVMRHMVWSSGNRRRKP